MVESCGMDATGKLERHPKLQILINRTPGEIGGGVQKGLVLGIGRQRNASVASKITWCWESDAMGMRERRPKSQILINRTPGEIGGGVQKGLVLGIGRH